MKKVKLSESDINKIVENTQDPISCLIGLYKAVINDWDKVTSVGHFPACSRHTHDVILNAMGKKYTPFDVNMLWLNKGFAEDANIKDFYVVVNQKLVKYS